MEILMVMLDLALILAIDLLAIRLWLAFLRRNDPFAADKHPSPQLRIFFQIGLLTVPAALLLYGLWSPLEQLLSSRSYVMNEFTGNFIVTGPVEELAKFGIFFLFATQNDSIKEPLDGVLQAASVAVAFAGIENFSYALDYGIGVLLIRSVISFAGHMAYAALWGFAAGLYLYSRKKGTGQVGVSLLLYALIISAALHGLFNFSLSMSSGVLAFLVKAGSILLAYLAYTYLRSISPYALSSRIPLSRWREGIRRMEEELRVNPRSAVFHHRLAVYHLCGGQHREAEKHFRIATRLNKGDHLSQIFLQVLRYLGGSREEREAAVEKLQGLKSRLGRARFGRGRIAVNRALSRRSIGREVSELLYNIQHDRDVALGRWRPASSDPRRYTVTYRRHRSAAPGVEAEAIARADRKREALARIMERKFGK
jgi:RsiW-degrading membrane proteinase PrsW (M82 family)